MRRPALFVLLLLTAGLTGCIGDDGADPGELDPAATPSQALSPKVHDILDVQEVWIPTVEDGKAMHTAVYRPDTDQPVPVFINFSPYWGDTAEEGGDGFAQYMIEEYVPRGYAVVLAAIRGTGHSEGCFQIGGDKEVAAMHDVITHFAEAEWSNGKIAAGGKSYDSTPQNGLIAKMPHEDLEGIFHVSGITDMYRYTYRNGVPYGHGAIFNTYYYGQTWHEYGLPLPLASGAGGDSDLSDDDPGSMARLADDILCPELPEMQANGVATAGHGMKTDYWIERDWNRDIADSGWNGSIFFVHGLQDWNVKPDHILPWLTQLPDQIQVKGWLHQNTENTGHVYPMRADWNATMLAWLDHTLKDEDVPIDWTIQAEGTDGTWREADTWPPVPEPTTIDLGVPEMSTFPDPGQLTEGPPVWTVEVANATDKPLRYAGAPTLDVTVTSDHPDPVLTAVLYDVGPDGQMTWVNEGVLRGVYRDGLDSPQPVVPQQPFQATLELYPQDDVLEPGHRWIAVLGEDPKHAEPTRAQLEGVMYGLDAATMHLPTAPVDTAIAEQPEPVPCFAC